MQIVSKPINIVIAGGNYAGLSAAKNLYIRLLATNPDYDGTKQAPLNPNVKITLIDRRNGFIHYLGMTRGISQPEYGSKLWLPYSDLPWLQHSSIVLKKNIISRITPTHVELADDDEHVAFDYLVIALGQSRNAPIGVASSTKAEYLEAMSKYQTSVKNAQSIVVVGGGAVGTELVADIKSDYPQKDVTLIHSRDLPIPGPFMDEFRHHVVDILRSLGVNTVFGERVIDEASEVESFSSQPHKYAGIFPELVDSVKCNATMTTSSGRVFQADLVFNTLGAKTKAPLVNLPSSTDAPIFSPTGIRVTGSMQIDDPKYPNIFAVGDVCNRDLVKLAGAAVSTGNLAGINIAKLVSALSGEQVELDMGSRGRGRGEKDGQCSAPLYGQMKLVLGEHNAVIHKGDGVIPPEVAKTMVAPDMKLGKALKHMFIGTFPVNREQRD
ncbi:hypothetical protein LPJ66_004843 [Kickxella alabastrina]|uniref:Uncharacterized protein n=1 Tax=Kickxella alabastrina TaxID=61397 RepID=A0ACC1IIJ7_9FUNG|nr:hypothetical protein LPJ66_004843 [Kickxella alabastrina]